MIKKVLFYIATLALVAACGRPMEARKIVAEATVGGKAVLLEAEEVDFSQAPSYQLETQVETFLSKEVLGLRIDQSGFDDFDIQIKLSENRTVLFENVQPGDGTVVTDTLEKYNLVLKCSSSDCESALITVLDKEKVEKTEFRYRRRAEFLTRESIQYLQGSTDILEALRMAIDALTTVQRHTVQLQSGKTLDLLIVIPPIPDGAPVNFSDAEDEEYFADQEVTAPAVAFVDEIEIISSGSGIRILETHQVPAPTETEQNSTPIIDDEEVKKNETDRPNGEVASCGSASDFQACSGRIRLTPNPWDAFGFEPPARLFKTSAAISNPTSNLIAMTIQPAQSTILDEPAHRISVLAPEFISQNVRISQNACNFYVRAVMVLSGYINTRNYLANDWENFFQTSNHGLKQWEKFEYSWTGNAKTNSSKSEDFKSRLKNMREGYSVIYQYENSNGAGHVAMLHRENGKIHYFDSMLNRRGPAQLTEGDPVAKKRLNIDKLFYSRYPKVRLFAIPGLLSPEKT